MYVHHGTIKIGSGVCHEIFVPLKRQDLSHLLSINHHSSSNRPRNNKTQGIYKMLGFTLSSLIFFYFLGHQAVAQLSTCGQALLFCSDGFASNGKPTF
jgi:hypothetical protein